MPLLALPCLLLPATALPSAAVAPDPPAPPATSPPDSLADPELMPFGAATAYLLGTTMMERGNYREALGYLHHAYTLTPDMPEIATAYLTALLALGYQQEALGVLDSLVDMEPEDPDHRRQRAALLADMRRYEEALADLDHLRLGGDDSTELRLMRAGLLARAGRRDEAFAAYRELLQNAPEEAEQVYLMMAEILEAEGDRRELESLWREALAARPESRRLRFGLLRFLVEERRIEEALRIVEEGEAVEASRPPGAEDGPGEPFSWQVEVADLLVQHDQVQLATELLLERHRADTLEEEASLWLARLLMSQRRLEEGREVLERVTRRWPEIGRGHFYLGDLLAVMGEAEPAERELRRAMELEPHRPDYVVSLVRLLTVRHGDRLRTAARDSQTAAIKQEIALLARLALPRLREDDHRSFMVLGFGLRSAGDFQRAAECFEVGAKEEDFRLDALLQLSACLDELGRQREARDALETARREYPADPSVANTLGYFLAEKGLHLERAETLIREALAADPDNGAYLDSLGWVYFQQGRLDEAFDQLVAATNALPDDPVILEHLGRTLLALGRPKEALGVLRQALAAGGDPRALRRLIQEIQDRERP